MKREFQYSLAVALVLGLVFPCRHALAAPDTNGPTAVATLDGRAFDLTHLVTIKGDVISLPTQTLTGAQGQSVTFSLSGCTDPYIDFTLSATNPLDVPDFFGLYLNAQILDCPVGSAVTSSLTYTLTPGTGPVTISPLATASYIGDPLVNGGSAGIPVGPGATFAGPGTRTLGPATSGFTSSLVSPVAVEQLGFLLLFDLSGGSSKADIVGHVECIAPTAVPEPGALALLVGGGLPIGLLVFRRLRRCVA